jgi:hypothetical protein
MNEKLLCEVEFGEGFMIGEGKYWCSISPRRDVFGVFVFLRSRIEKRFPGCVTRDKDLATSHETFALPRADHLSQFHV